MTALIDHTKKPPRFAVVHVDARTLRPQDDGLRTSADRLAEAVNLATALGVDVVHTETVPLVRPNPKTFIGGGRVEELTPLLKEKNIAVVLVNADISPTQQRNLETAWEVKVIDRTGLILEIFSARARTKAGKLQVELAQLAYQQSRLVRTWTHLERQRGGLGKTGGPGERQIEIDRRLIRDRMALIRRELEDVEQERALQRRARKRAGTPVVALVGYTNAGKSTLFNRLVGETTFAADQVFATLDPLMRKLKLPSGREVVLADTVGFVADLPHELVQAFHATLEEVALADLLLHVHDISSPDYQAQMQDVHAVLKSINADGIATLMVANKADKKTADARFDKTTFPVSALTGAGVPELVQAIDNTLSSHLQHMHLQIPAADGKCLAWLHSHGEVMEKQLHDETYTLHVRLPAATAAQFSHLWPHYRAGDDVSASPPFAVNEVHG